MAPLIAIVGSDGSGKSTVGEALLAWMNERQPTELHHLGKQTGNIGRAIARWPLIGGRLDKTIVKQSAGAKQSGAPSAFTAAIIYTFSMRRVRRFKKMLAARARGIAILADRFPQTGVPGPMDGLGLAKAAAGFPGRLARRERAQYEWMEQYRPDLVIRLNVDLPTALARKPDHRPSSLATKIADVPRLTFNGAPIVDLDSTQPLDRVIEQAKAAISKALGW
ncbi:nucleoside/nucleotide kinase family protein [Sphingomonas hylomeconis]|uniref:Nucleoside triphosphate hydrolase n=1 Tax=Sphingomonas hylomeconis TaxID=1395958 RepID=A0ABV7SS02_9SPHN|nr:nucleoside triphosphate hydrolase [Sphingomonas hylomeconis]